MGSEGLYIWELVRGTGFLSTESACLVYRVLKVHWENKWQCEQRRAGVYIAEFIFTKNKKNALNVGANLIKLCLSSSCVDLIQKHDSVIGEFPQRCSFIQTQPDWSCYLRL